METHGLKPRRQTVGRKTRYNLNLRSKCRSSHPTPQRDSGRSLTTPSTSTSTPHTNHTTSSIGIQGADVDLDGYAEAAGNLEAQARHN
uniref:Uncharacterized protein n=1 Tax=Oryza barthii TaxID=65489 RepID=A0A0D3FKM3_9ORYZ